MSEVVVNEIENEVPVPYEPTVAEVERLRAHLDHAASQAIERFRKEEWLTDDEIVSVVESLSSDAEHYRQQIRNTAPEDLKVADFGMLSMFDPRAGREEMDRFRRLARSEFANGLGAAKSLYGRRGGSFWESETFAQLLKQFEEDWAPQSAIEWNLLQSVAQSWVMQQRWIERLSTMEADLFNRERMEHEHHGGWLSPRVSEYEAMNQAAAMIERFNRMSSRNIRALKDLRRPSVHIDRANIANQQIVVEHP